MPDSQFLAFLEQTLSKNLFIHWIRHRSCRHSGHGREQAVTRWCAVSCGELSCKGLALEG